MTSSEFLTTRQLAERWQISESTLHQWRAKQQGPGFSRLGSRVLYPLAEVEQYEQANTTTHRNS